MTNQNQPDFGLDDDLTNVTFGSIDDILEQLKSIPGINDNYEERMAAREKYEEEFRLRKQNFSE